MISRRTILKWLGLLPVAATAMPGLAIGNLNATAGAVRSRAWKIALEPDGSSVLVDGNDRWLPSWLKTQKTEDWGDGRRYIAPRLDEIEQIIKDDAEAVKVRSDHWRDFKAFQHENGVEVTAEFTEPGVRLKNDPPVLPHKPFWYPSPVFQFSEKDW